jgi:hypothetical protein
MHGLPEIQVQGNGLTLTPYGKESLTQGGTAIEHGG